MNLTTRSDLTRDALALASECGYSVEVEAADGSRLVLQRRHAQRTLVLQLGADRTAEGSHSIEGTAEGLLLDGRNRLRACEELGLDPATTVYEGEPVVRPGCRPFRPNQYGCSRG